MLRHVHMCTQLTLSCTHYHMEYMYQVHLVIFISNHIEGKNTEKLGNISFNRKKQDKRRKNIA